MIRRVAAEVGRFTFPVHPRTRARLERPGPWTAWTTPTSSCSRPSPYADMLDLLAGARVVADRFRRPPGGGGVVGGPGRRPATLHSPLGGRGGRYVGAGRPRRRPRGRDRAAAGVARRAGPGGGASRARTATVTRPSGSPTSWPTRRPPPSCGSRSPTSWASRRRRRGGAWREVRHGCGGRGPARRRGHPGVGTSSSRLRLFSDAVGSDDSEAPAGGADGAGRGGSGAVPAGWPSRPPWRSTRGSWMPSPAWSSATGPSFHRRSPPSTCCCGPRAGSTSDRAPSRPTPRSRPSPPRSRAVWHVADAEPTPPGRPG